MDKPVIESESAGVKGPQCDDDDEGDNDEAIDSAGEKRPDAIDSAGETRLLVMKLESRGILSDCNGTPVVRPCWTCDWPSKWKVWNES